MHESCGRFGTLPADCIPAKHGDDGDKKAEREVDGQRDGNGPGVAGGEQRLEDRMLFICQHQGPHYAPMREVEPQGKTTEKTAETSGKKLGT